MKYRGSEGAVYPGLGGQYTVRKCLDVTVLMDEIIVCIGSEVAMRFVHQGGFGRSIAGCQKSWRRKC